MLIDHPSFFEIDGMKDLQPKCMPSLEGTVVALDGIRLSYMAFAPKDPLGCLIFLHGGGAHAAAGYTLMAEQLKDKYQMATFLPDLRGHGKSDGIRGYAPSQKQVWMDVSSLIRHVKTLFANKPIYLGGHSSGAGLVVNYSAWKERERVTSYILIAPHLGCRDLLTAQGMKFAKVNLPILFLNQLSLGFLFPKSLVVKFNYSQHQIENFGLLKGYTTSMSIAVTPRDSKALLEGMKMPTCLIAAGQDELFDIHQLEFFLKPILEKNKQIQFNILSSEKHISILGRVAQPIGEFLRSSKASILDFDKTCT